MSRVELHKTPNPQRDNKPDWYWRFWKNGNVMADGGAYSRRIDPVIDLTKQAKR
jgi:hypothetical protein